MQLSLTTNGLKDLFVFPFRDTKWGNKFVIGSLVTLPSVLIPILPAVFLFGYYARMFKQVAVEGQEPALPEWDDWGALFTDGLRVFGVWFIYFLPAFVLFLMSYIVLFGVAFVDALSNSGSTAQGLAPLFGSFGMLGFLGLAFLYSLAVSFVLPAATGHVIARDQFAAGFYFSQWWSILRANLGGFIVSFILIFGLTLLMQFTIQILYFTIILCCFIPIVLSPILFYISTIAAVLFAEAYRQGIQEDQTSHSDDGAVVSAT